MNNKKAFDTSMQITSSWPWWVKAKKPFRNFSIYLKSVNRKIDNTNNWIRFPFYHHVFIDERDGFRRQIDYLRNFGEFLSLDDAVSLLRSGQPIDGRYFSITFDDGIDGCYEYAFPILVEKGVSAAFFVMPDYMAESKGQENRICRPMVGLKFNVRYFTWDECREMAQANMIIGSHTRSHIRLSETTDDKVLEDLKSSKKIIEEKIGRPCNHFACPWGRVGIDFHPGHHEKLVRQAGYLSFLTVQNGAMRQGDSPYFIKRNFLYANTGNYQLRYFFSP